jgi:hypothetical protein
MKRPMEASARADGLEVSSMRGFSRQRGRAARIGWGSLAKATALALSLAACGAGANGGGAGSGGAPGAGGAGGAGGSAIENPSASGGAPAAPQIVVAPAPTQAILRGLVTDSDSGAAIAGVTVKVGAGGNVATSGSDGRFELSVAAGALALSASPSGYFGWQRDVVLVGATTNLEIRLLKKTAEMPIAPDTTTTLSAGGASFSVPPGAYGSGVTGSVAYLPPAHIGASPGPVQFQDEHGETNRVLGVLTVDLPSTPGSPVTVKAPVPAGSSADHLFLYRLVNGAWADPIAAKGVTGTEAAFETVYTGSVAVVERAPDDAFVVTSRSSASTTEGELLAPGAMVAVAEAALAVQSPQGDVLEIPAGLEAMLAMVDEEAGTPRLIGAGFAVADIITMPRLRFPVVTLPKPGNGPGYLRGVVRPPVKALPDAPQPRVDVRGGTAGSVFTVRGGVFQYAERPCGPGVIIVAEISGGTGALTLPMLAPTALPAGSRLVTCVNCGSYSSAADGSCQSPPAMAGTRGDGGVAPASDAGPTIAYDGGVPPPSGGGTRPPTGDAAVPSGAVDAMPPGPCNNGLACAEGSICRGPVAPDGSTYVCKCDGGRFICSASSDSRIDGGTTAPPPIGGVIPPEACKPGLMCAEGSYCRAAAADGSITDCKCAAGMLICSTYPGSTGAGGTGGTTTPPPPPIPPESCKPGLMCPEGGYCRAPNPDGSVTECKCNVGALICTTYGGGSSTGPADAGTSTPPPPPPPISPESCKAGLMCAEGSYCRVPNPDGSVSECKCGAGALICSTYGGSTGAGGTSGTTTPPPIPPDACKSGYACPEGSYCKGAPKPEGTIPVCKCSAGLLVCQPG